MDGERPHSDVRMACGHMATVYWLAQTDFERIAEKVECEADICLPCLNTVIATGGYEGLLAHVRSLRERVAA
jgi:hypothetical protein